jgi:transcriptional regulator with XRE-family HTH domain
MIRFAMSDVSERVSRARHRLGWSQARLAGEAGVSRSHISMIEAGHLPGVTADTVRKLAQALGVTSDWLLGLK